MNIKSIIKSRPHTFILTVAFSLSMAVAGCDTTGTDLPETFVRTVPATDGTAEAAAWTRAIVETKEGGYLLAGEVETSNNGLDVYVALIDEYGELIWEKTFGGPYDDRAYDLIQTHAGDFVITGVKNDSYLYLFRIDVQGQVNWEFAYRRFDEPSHLAGDEGFAITQADDGGFAITGRTSIPYTGGGGGYLAPSVLRVDSEGKQLWFEHYYDGVGIGHALAIIQTPDGDFLVPGLYASAWPFRVTEDGTLVQPVMRSEKDIVYNDIAALDDGTYVMTGDGFNNSLITVTKVNSNEEELWSRNYGYGTAHSLTVTQDGGVVVAGSLRGEDTNDHQIYLFKIDMEGELIWKTTKELAGPARLFGIQETHAGDIIATGRFEFPGWRVPVYPLVLRADAQGHIREIGPVLSPGTP